MAKYHINDKGNPGKCGVTVGTCPYGGDHQHYGSMEDARAAFELSMAGREMVGMKKKAKPVEEEATFTMVRDPGEHPYEVMASASGKDLGTISYREGLYIAAVHNGRRPQNVGTYYSREEAATALLKNDGAGQEQKSDSSMTDGYPSLSEYKSIIKKMDDVGLEKELATLGDESDDGRFSKDGGKQAYVAALEKAHREWHVSKFGFEKSDLSFNSQERFVAYRKNEKYAKMSDEGLKAQIKREKADWVSRSQTQPAESYGKNVPIRLVPVGSMVHAPYSGRPGQPYKKVGTPVDNGPIWDKETNAPSKEHDIVGKYHDGIQWDYVSPDTTFDMGVVPAGKGLSPRWKTANMKAEKLKAARNAYSAYRKSI